MGFTLTPNQTNTSKKSMNLNIKKRVELTHPLHTHYKCIDCTCSKVYPEVGYSNLQALDGRVVEMGVMSSSECMPNERVCGIKFSELKLNLIVRLTNSFMQLYNK